VSNASGEVLVEGRMVAILKNTAPENVGNVGIGNYRTA